MTFKLPKGIKDSRGCAIECGNALMLATARQCEGGNEVIFRPTSQREPDYQEVQMIKNMFWDNYDMVMEHPIKTPMTTRLVSYCFLKNN